MRARRGLERDRTGRHGPPAGSDPGGLAVSTGDPAGRVCRGGIAALRDVWRPATLVLLLVPVSLLGGGTSTAGRLAAAAAAGALAVAAAVLVAVGVLPFRRTYCWVGLLAGLLLVSFLFPQVKVPITVPAERHRIVDLLGMLRGLAPTQLSRLSDLAGLLAGLALLGVSVAWSPHPRHVVRMIALTGAVAAGYTLVRGGYVSGRLEGLGCTANYLGIVLAVPLVAAVALMRYTRNPKWLVPAAVCFVALADTQSRGAFLATAAGVAFAFGQGRSPRCRALFGCLVVALGVAAAAAGQLSSIGGAVGSLGAGDRTAVALNTSNGVRVQVAELAVRVIMEHPLRGIGYWMFPAYAERAPEFGRYLTTHDEYLRLGAEAGVLPLVVFVVLLWRGVRPRRTGDLAVLRAVVVAFGVALLFANPLGGLGISAPFWVSLGCLLARTPHKGDPADTGAVPAAPVTAAVEEMKARNAPQPT